MDNKKNTVEEKPEVVASNKPAIAVEKKASVNWLKTILIVLFVIIFIGGATYMVFSILKYGDQPKTSKSNASVNSALDESAPVAVISLNTDKSEQVPSINNTQAIPVAPNPNNNPLLQHQQLDQYGQPIKPRSRFDAPLNFTDSEDASMTNKPLGKIQYAGQVTDQRVANAINGIPEPKAYSIGEVDAPQTFTGGLGVGGDGSGNSMNLNSMDTPKALANYIGNRNYTLAKGSMIECVLNTALDSSLPGMTSCAVTRNIYSDNGKVVMIERGAVLTGEYKSDVKTGQARLAVLWNRIRTPHGVIINLNSLGTDTLGRSGQEGLLDNRWFDRIGAAFLLSIIKDAIAYEAAKSGSAVGASVYQNTTQAGESLADTVLKETINVRPVITKNQGERISIFVARDLDFSRVYQLKTKDLP